MSLTARRLDSSVDPSVLPLNRGFAFNPLSVPICTRTPRRLGVPSARVAHAPFAMALVAMARPRLLVELGTHWGLSYCAFCQAVKELGLATRCYAVDTWRGDPQAAFYTTEALADLMKHHDARYGLFSELVPSSFADALPRFADGSIDVLHIDGCRSYEAVRADFESWLPKMSSGGLVLFHDTEVRDRDDFGVWRLWDEVKHGRPYFEFRHAHGLGVLAVGEDQPEGLRPLLSAPPDEAERVREFFRNLGDRLAELHEAAIQKKNIRELLHGKIDELQNEVNAVRCYYGRAHFRAAERLEQWLRRRPRLLRLARAAVAARRKFKRLFGGGAA